MFENDLYTKFQCPLDDFDQLELMFSSRTMERTSGAARRIALLRRLEQHHNPTRINSFVLSIIHSFMTLELQAQIYWGGQNQK